MTPSSRAPSKPHRKPEAAQNECKSCALAKRLSRDAICDAKYGKILGFREILTFSQIRLFPWTFRLWEFKKLNDILWNFVITIYVEIILWLWTYFSFQKCVKIETSASDQKFLCRSWEMNFQKFTRTFLRWRDKNSRVEKKIPIYMYLKIKNLRVKNFEARKNHRSKYIYFPYLN